ncbi:hypothetical protein D1614_10945 [Maribellus luteus]|uniref:Uncharacterized protein n=1 Tax=Maribellus luteus TaxID=2305463 RepID=A0A399T050_9BACT|nr:ABC transporter permease [Maribellus luteus]RIJ48242.1 hypothetical protein D1614_10945 [Maribellus luteus]
MINQLFRIAFRKLKSGYSVINVLGLTISLSFACLLALWIMHDTRTDRFHPGSENIFLVGSEFKYSSETVKGPSTPGPLADALKAENPEIQQTTRFVKVPMPLTVKVGDQVFIESSIASIDSTFFELFGFKLVQGSPSSVLRQSREIILSERMARKYFGNENPMGKSLLVMGEMPLTVCGVFEDLPDNTQFEFDMAFPYDVLKTVNPYAEQWNASGTNTWVKLNPGVDAKAFSEKIKNTINNHTSNNNQDIHLIGINDFYYDQSYAPGYTKKGNFQYVRLLFAVTLFILLIAAVNFVNLNTAMASQRFKEIGLKKVLGSDHRSVALQFLGESFAVALIATIASWGLTIVLLPIMESVVGFNMGLGQFFSDLISVSLILTVIMGVIGGAYPSFFLASKPIVAVFKDPTKNLPGRFSLEKALVVVQFSIAIFLIAGTLLISKQMSFLKQKDLGFDKAQVALIKTNPELSGMFSMFKSEMKQSGLIENVSCIDLFPSYLDNWTSSIDWEGKDATTKVSIAGNWVDPSFLETMGIGLLAGRDFLPDSKADRQTGFIINKKAQELMNVKDAAGKSFSYQGRKGIIIGVMDDAQFQSLHTTCSPRVLTLVESPAEYPQIFAGGTVIVRIAKGKTTEARQILEKWFAEHHIAAPLELHFLDQEYAAMYVRETRMSRIFSIFSLLCILISCMGVFILNAFYALKKSKEIAVRRINGAQISSVFVGMVEYLLRWVAVALVISVLPSYFLLHKWLENFAYKTTLSWWIFALAGVLALGIALLTVSWQSWQAATRNPVEALRYE